MANRVACQYCGKEMAKGSMWAHERHRCEKRPGAGDHPAPVRKKPGPKPGTAKKSSKKAAGLHRAIAAPVDAMAEAAVNTCPLCSPGTNSALERQLITEAIRGGMTLDVAAGFVRRAMSMLG